jgi:hypothetical protein
MREHLEPGRLSRSKDGQIWRIGKQADVDWIVETTPPGLSIASAVPPVFASCATVVTPPALKDQSTQDQVVVNLVSAHTPDQPWWLGYLETGLDDVVFPDAPRVRIYSRWQYVLVEAGPDQARSWRSAHALNRGAIPDLIYPADRSWLLSRLWDDDWRCLGGPHLLVDAFLREPALEARAVTLTEDATPPGHIAL